jgi:nucleoside-diphosphate-sugar epimerase
MRVLVTGAGGFIGYHLAGYLRDRGHTVIGVDQHWPLYGDTKRFEQFLLCDLRSQLEIERLRTAVNARPERIYHLAADMGGIGFITRNHATIFMNNNAIDAHVLDLAVRWGVERLFYSSSACVYATNLQDEDALNPPRDMSHIMGMATQGLSEEMAWPARPEPGYGLQKLCTEELCRYFAEEFKLQTRVARFHNCFGTQGAYDGGREKAPAALCRKAAQAPNPGSIEVWGDGEQGRSFIYIDDLCRGIDLLMNSDCSDPINLGSDRMVTIGDLAEMIIKISGKALDINFVEGPQGVRARNSDNSKAKAVLGFEPQISLEDGLARTYAWIAEQVAKGQSTGCG